ncbi:MAG: exo-alpha-sialidase, partial [Planctomycetia bacterium]
MPCILSLVVLLLAAAQVAAAAPAEAVLSPEIVRATAEARRNGEASLVELKDGSLLLLYGAHSKPGDWDRGEIRQIRSRDRGKTWSEPETLFSDPKRSLFQCSLARLQSGDLGLTHSSLANGTDAIKVFRRSSDDGKTWSEPIVISDKAHAYTTGPWDKLYVLESGRLLALLHCNL